MISLGVCWVFWCFLHSLLICKSVQGYCVRVAGQLGFAGFRYRLFYTVISLLTLLPLVAATFIFRGARVFAWQGGWHLLEAVLAVCALWLFRAGAEHYDLHEMVYGKKQEKSADSVSFSRAGVHGMVRHPWYLGSLIFLWVWPVYHEATFLAAIILSCYLVIGSFIEERRLVADFGEKYRQYQKEVSMLIPIKWVAKKLNRGK